MHYVICNTCEQWVTVSFYNEWATTGVDDPLEQVTVVSWDPAVYPNVNPSKEGYTFAGWVDTNGDPADLTSVTQDMDVFASFNGGCPTWYHVESGDCVINTYKITWTFRNTSGEWVTNSWDFAWWSELNFLAPMYPKSLETKYTLTWWDPELTWVKENAVYTAIYTEEPRPYTVTFVSSGENYGTVSPESVTEGYGAQISISNNIVTISWTTVTATATWADVQYTYAFSGWNNTCGNTITWDCTITAEFTRTVNEYNIIYHLNWWSESTPNPTSYTVESSNITLNNPTKVGYTFLWWTGSNNLNEPELVVTIPAWSTGPKDYYANWQADNVDVTVHYFTKQVDPVTNTLIDNVDESQTKTVQVWADSEFNIYTDCYEGIEWFEYVKATVSESDSSAFVCKCLFFPGKEQNSDCRNDLSSFHLPGAWNTRI